MDPQQETSTELRRTDPGSLDAHRLMVMCVFISTAVIGMVFLGLVLYFNATGRGGVTS